MLPQFTYSDMKKQDSRDEIMLENFCSIGTQAGNFGVFKEHFRTISKDGGGVIKSELEYTASLLGLDYDQFMETMPELKGLIK